MLKNVSSFIQAICHELLGTKTFRKCNTFDIFPQWIDIGKKKNFMNCINSYSDDAGSFSKHFKIKKFTKLSYPFTIPLDSHPHSLRHTLTRACGHVTLKRRFSYNHRSKVKPG